MATANQYIKRRPVDPKWALLNKEIMEKKRVEKRKDLIYGLVNKLDAIEKNINYLIR
jgi:hypothetical protein